MVFNKLEKGLENKYARLQPNKNIANLCLGQLLQQCLSIYVKLYGHQNFMHTFNAQQTGQIIATWCLQSQPLRARGELTRVQFLKANPPN
jgi:hypothetical protein